MTGREDLQGEAQGSFRGAMGEATHLLHPSKYQNFFLFFLMLFFFPFQSGKMCILGSHIRINTKVKKSRYSSFMLLLEFD